MTVNDHINKVTSMPIRGKNPLSIFFSENKRPMTLGLDVALGMWAIPGLHK